MNSKFSGFIFLVGVIFGFLIGSLEANFTLKKQYNKGRFDALIDMRKDLDSGNIECFSKQKSVKCTNCDSDYPENK